MEFDRILITVLLDCQLTFSMTPVKLCCCVIFPIKMLKYRFLNNDNAFSTHFTTPIFSSLHNIRQVTFSVGTAGMYSKSFLQKWNSVVDKLQSWALIALFQIFETTIKSEKFYNSDRIILLNDDFTFIRRLFGSNLKFFKVYNKTSF